MAATITNTRFITQPCLVCNLNVHSSNKKRQCLICSRIAHLSCLNYSDGIYYCCHCISDAMPFVHMEDDDDFFNQFGILNYTRKVLIENAATQRLNINPFHDIDDNFIDNPDIDADANYYNDVSENINGYFDSDELNQFIAQNVQSDGLHSLLHINANNLVTKVDTLYANLQNLNHKFSVIAVTETHTNASTESLVVIPGYDQIIKSRKFAVRGGVALYFNSDLNLDMKHRNDLACDDEQIMGSLFVQIHQTNSRDVIIGVIYKRPHTNVTDFLSKLEIILKQVATENRQCYLTGDFNINLLNCKESHTF